MRVAVLSEALTGLGGAEKHGLAFLKPLLGLHEIDIYYRGGDGPFDLARISDRFGIDLPGVRLVPIGHLWGMSRITAGYDLFINTTFGNLTVNRAARGVLLIFFPVPLDDRPGRSPLRLADQWFFRRQGALLDRLDRIDPGVLTGSFRDYLDAHGPARALGRLPLFALRKLGWLGGPGRYRLGTPALDTYDRLVANSEFTARWTRDYYGRPAEVLYPPSDVEQFPPGEKGPIVLSVGRFQPEPSSKKHHVMISAFKALYDEGALRPWRMWVCGGSDGTPGYEAYIGQLRRQAEGYPITIDVNPPFARLAGLYGRASLYWHAMGYGQDPARHPGRFEHFGMTTVEAMAAGCIPMVINGGGQPEVVRHGSDGFVWDEPDDLATLVRAFVAMDDREVGRLREAARARAGAFDEGRFLRRARSIYRDLGVSTREVGEPEGAGELARGGVP